MSLKVALLFEGLRANRCGAFFGSRGRRLFPVLACVFVSSMPLSIAAPFQVSSQKRGIGVLETTSSSVAPDKVIAAVGQQIVVTNPLLGVAPTFQANLYTTFGNPAIPMSVKLFSCIASKLSFGTKLEDFVIPEMDFDILANAAGSVLTWSLGEVG